MLKKSFLILIHLIVFLVIFQLPVQVVYNGHDAGSEAALEYWTQHGFNYGTDIIQNVGPLGFLFYTRIFTGSLDHIKFFCNILLTISFVILLFKSSEYLDKFIKILFILLACFFAIGDVGIYVILLLISHQLIYSKKIIFSLFMIIILSFLSLTKGTYFFISIAIIAANFICLLLKKKYRDSIFSVSSYIFVTLIFWNISGQDISNILKFFFEMISFTGGYNEAMTIFENNTVRNNGLISLLLIVVPIIQRIYICINQPDSDNKDIYVNNLTISLLEIFILFVVWKHSFVRADGHITMFFYYVIFSALWIYFRNIYIDDLNKIKTNIKFNMNYKYSIPLSFIIYICSFSGLNAQPFISPVNFNYLLSHSLEQIKNNVLAITDLNSYFYKLSNELLKSKQTIEMSKSKELVGDNSISYFGMLPAVMLYNNFNYKPLPSTISFAAWNESIMNADVFYLKDDKRAPLFLLYDLKTIDNRLSAQDDSLAQLEIFNLYKLIDIERGNIILKRQNSKNNLLNNLIHSKKKSLDNWIDVPYEKSLPTWVKISIEESIFTKIVSFLYKPPQYYIKIKFLNDSEKTFKFIPNMAKTGFMINPLVTDNREFLAVRTYEEYSKYLNNDKQAMISKVTNIKIGCNKLEFLCGNEATFTFEEINNLELGSDIDQYKLYQLSGKVFDFDAEIFDMKITSPIENIIAFGNLFYQFHAPSQIILNKKRNNLKLAFSYGLSPASYEIGGRDGMDGVEISIKFVNIKNHSVLLFKKDLNPILKKEDRGNQNLEINLPLDEGKLIIEIDPKKSTAYDQFIIRGINLINFH